MNKSIVTCVILTIITCGLYGIYWMYCINEAACQINPAEWYTSFGLVVLFTILTCGIYGLYWNYKIGKALAAAPGGAGSVKGKGDRTKWIQWELCAAPIMWAGCGWRTPAVK